MTFQSFTHWKRQNKPVYLTFPCGGHKSPPLWPAGFQVGFVSSKPVFRECSWPAAGWIIIASPHYTRCNTQLWLDKLTHATLSKGKPATPIIIMRLLAEGNLLSTTIYYSSIVSIATTNLSNRIYIPNRRDRLSSVHNPVGCCMLKIWNGKSFERTSRIHSIG